MKSRTIFASGRAFVAIVGGWPTLNMESTLEGAPFKLRLGGVFS